MLRSPGVLDPGVFPIQFHERHHPPISVSFRPEIRSSFSTVQIASSDATLAGRVSLRLERLNESTQFAIQEIQR
jgi:hypothetical protein